MTPAKSTPSGLANPRPANASKDPHPTKTLPLPPPQAQPPHRRHTLHIGPHQHEGWGGDVGTESNPTY